MKSFAFKFPLVSHWGHSVSHAKNRKKRGFKYNLHTVTILVNGVKKRLSVPARMIRVLKKAGVTTHFKKATAS
jgi:ribosomal protein L28